MHISPQSPIFNSSAFEIQSALLKTVQPFEYNEFFEKLFNQNIPVSSFLHCSSTTLSILAWSPNDFLLDYIISYCLDDPAVDNVCIYHYIESNPKHYSDNVSTILCDSDLCDFNQALSLTSLHLPLSRNVLQPQLERLTSSVPFFTDSFGYNHYSLYGLVCALRDCNTQSIVSLFSSLHSDLPKSSSTFDISDLHGPHLLRFFPNKMLKYPVIRQIDFPAESLSPNLPAEAISKGLQIVSISSCHSFDHSKSSALFNFELLPSDFLPYMLTIFLNKGGGGNSLMSTIAQSLSCPTIYAEDYLFDHCGIPFVWGVLRNSKNVIDHAINNSNHYLYADHSYFSRGHGSSYRVSANSFECNTYKVCPSDRRDLFDIPLQPWNKSGSKIVVCPPTEYFVEAHKVYGWLDNTICELKKHTDRKIVVRKKPKPGEHIIPLSEQLKTAHALVTHSSNVAIESICAGTPVFVSDTSAARVVGLSDLSFIENPIYPDRNLWLNNLTYSQYSFDEFQSGKFFDVFKEYHSFDDIRVSS